MNEWEAGPAGPMSDEALEAIAARLESMPLDDAVRVAELLAECRRARQAENQLRAAVDGAASEAYQTVAGDIAQVVLDAAEWLKTLWNVGYMGAGRFPASPRSEFPAVEVEDVLKSALLQRIRGGRRPLPFPPPTRRGVPWHEVVEGDDEFLVDAELIREDDGRVVGANIEGCVDWIADESSDGVYVVQHQRKGPCYRLSPNFPLSRLRRLPPQWTRRIVCRDRAGFRGFMLEWFDEGGGAPRRIPLKAATFERALVDAQFWVATYAPQMYGQIRFEPVVE